MPVAGGRAVTLAASLARTASANGAAQEVGGWSRAIFVLDHTAAATDAGDTLDVYVDVSPDGGATWLNAAHFAQKAGNAVASKEFAVLNSDNPGALSIVVTADAAAGAVRPALFAGHVRARWAIADVGGDDASHTFAVTGYLY